MKKQTKQTNEEYEHYKFLFEVRKKESKKIYFSKLIGKYKDNTKNVGYHERNLKQGVCIKELLLEKNKYLTTKPMQSNLMIILLILDLT